MSANRLHGKTILITGCSAGIGHAIALEFARTSPNALKLIITARRHEPLLQLAKLIASECGSGVQVLPLTLDIGDRAAVNALISNLPAEYKQIDILVNNAGLARGRDHVGQITEADMNLTYDTNVLGTINVTQAVLPMMLAHNTPRGGSADNGDSPEVSDESSPGQGTIITIGSIAGLTPYPGGSIYCSTKSAVHTFIDSLRRDLIATRIRVIEIIPGQVETEFTLHRNYGDEEIARKFYAGQESLTPGDVAEIVVFAAGRRENVVFAEGVVFPSHQAAADVLYKAG